MEVYESELLEMVSGAASKYHIGLGAGQDGAEGTLYWEAWERNNAWSQGPSTPKPGFQGAALGVLLKTHRRLSGK